MQSCIVKIIHKDLRTLQILIAIDIQILQIINQKKMLTMVRRFLQQSWKLIQIKASIPATKQNKNKAELYCHRFTFFGFGHLLFVKSPSLWDKSQACGGIFCPAAGCVNLSTVTEMSLDAARWNLYVFGRSYLSWATSSNVTPLDSANFTKCCNKIITY